MLDVLNAVAAAQYIPPRNLVPNLSDPLCNAIDRMLQVDPNYRYNTVDELLADLFDEGAVGHGIHRKKSVAITRLIGAEHTELFESGPTDPGPPPVPVSPHIDSPVAAEHAVAVLFVGTATASLIATLLTAP